MSPRLTVQSEIFTTNEECNVSENEHNKVDTETHFEFKIKNSYTKANVIVDTDGDLILQRKPYSSHSEVLKIEHSKSTVIDLVGLQVWRGALLLADFISNFGDTVFQNKTVVELGSGVGLTSIVASIYSKRVICTDVNIGDILSTISKNIENNKQLIKCYIEVEEINFYNRNWSAKKAQIFTEADIILAADVIYDNDLTEEFVQTLMKITEIRHNVVIYIALEKRYVFTIADLDVVAPCYDYFIEYLKMTIKNFSLSWQLQHLPINFPHYFDYKRTKDLVLLQITCHSQ